MVSKNIVVASRFPVWNDERCVDRMQWAIMENCNDQRVLVKNMFTARSP